MIYAHRLFHGLPANQSENRRLAINYSSIPIEAESLHYRFSRDSKVETQEVSPRYYYHMLDKEEQIDLYSNRKNIDGAFLNQADVDQLVH